MEYFVRIPQEVSQVLNWKGFSHITGSVQMDSKEKNTLEHQTQPENRNGFGVTNSSGDHAIDVVHSSSLEESEGEGLKSDLQYGLEETPPWYMCIALGFQHYLTMFGATIAVPLILSNDLCMQDDPVAIGSLIGTIFFVSGLSTILQSTFGNRLPIIQGATFALLPPAQAILKTDGDCPEPLLANATVVERAERTELWQSRLRLIQGAIIVASFVEIIIGFTGIIGVFLRFIGPLTIAPTLCLIGLSLFGAASDYAGQNWLLATITIILMVLFSQYLNKVPVPLPGFSSEKKCHIVWVPVFKLFPVILAILIAWIFAAIFTAANVFPVGSTARTDTRADVLRDSAWFDFPYPFQWGIPTVTVAGVLGMIAGILASMIESVGDYYACARLAGAPPPPEHAVNRGIGMEGFGSLLAGMWGSGNGTTSYSENIGAIGITKVASRRVVQTGAVFMLFLGAFAKFGALFVTIPDPIVGGMFCTLFGVIAAVGLSNLQFVNLNSSRNLFVLGFSLFMGFTIPYYISGSPIETNSTGFNDIANVLLSTNMFVGGVIAAVLDNTIPGTLEDRGIAQWRKTYGDDSRESEKGLLKCYDFPVGMAWIKRTKIFRYFPFCPTFVGLKFKKCCKKQQNSDIPETNDADVVVMRMDSSMPIADAAAT